MGQPFERICYSGISSSDATTASLFQPWGQDLFQPWGQD